MTDAPQTQVATDKQIAEIVERVLPEPSVEIKPLAVIDDDERRKVEELINEINMNDSNSIIFFGTKAQEELSTISDNMLDGVRNKDVGPAANSLNEMVTTLRGFGAEDLVEKPGFFARLFGRARPIAKFLGEYEQIRSQIDTITDKLEGHKTQLLTDVASLDRLYDSSLAYFHDLEDYVLAGEEKLKELDETIIPQLAKQAEDADDVITAQQLRDLRSARDDLERRIHDLRLTRQVTMQALPSIRLVQENDKGLVRKIQSTVANTVPLWKQQLAQAVTIYRSGQAADTVKAATDLTNDLLEKNAENLQVANKKVREEVERGVFDIEVVKRANAKLIETIEDSLRIADEGKRKRAEAVAQLETTESNLKQALSAAHARAQDISPEARRGS